MSKKRYSITCSAFDKRGRLICSTNNSYKDSCSLMRYYAMKTGNTKKPYNHAEIACIDRANKLRKTIDKLVILRYDCYGSLKNSKPCEICSLAIEDFGIKHVFYSTENGMQKL